MSSLGANYALINVQQQRQKEKMKRVEEERARKEGEGGRTEKVVVDHRGVKGNRVHPQGLLSPGSDHN